MPYPNLPQTGPTGLKSVPPLVAAGTSQGVSPPAMVLAPGSDDDRGALTFGTGGSGVSAGVVCSFTWNNPKDPNRLPVVQVTETTGALALLGAYVSAVTATGFTVSVSATTVISQGNTVYGFNWSVDD
jgi:hypothetical protein